MGAIDEVHSTKLSSPDQIIFALSR
jgi:hypothetical protein